MQPSPFQLYKTLSYRNLTKHLPDRRNVSERVRIDWVQSIFAWPLGKHLQSRRYLSDPFLLQRDDPSVGDTPAIPTLIADWRLSEIHQRIPFLWWMERKNQANIISITWVFINDIWPDYYFISYIYWKGRGKALPYQLTKS